MSSIINNNLNDNINFEANNTLISTPDFPNLEDNKRKISEIENEDILRFEVIRNNNNLDVMKKLVALKNVFSRQLPKMPIEQVTKIVFDSKHESVALLKNNKIIGGCCQKPETDHNFAEIVFIAVKGEEQIQGQGTKIMNYVKQKIKTYNIKQILTQADNYAVGYFKKQGFQSDITLPEQYWKGLIKDQDSATLVECIVYHNVDQLKIGDKIKKRKELILKQLSINNPSLEKRTGSKNWLHLLPETERKEHLTYENKEYLSKVIPGQTEAGYNHDEFMKIQNKKLTRPQDLQTKFNEILTQFEGHPHSWPFMNKVDSNIVTDYQDIVKEPMWINKMKEKLDNNNYLTKNEFIYDLRLIIQNARLYNDPGTIYYKYANTFEKLFQHKINSIPDDSEDDQIK